MPALRTAPSLREQLDVQKNLVFLLQRRLDLQDTFSQQALIDQRFVLVHDICGPSTISTQIVFIS